MTLLLQNGSFFFFIWPIYLFFFVKISSFSYKNKNEKKKNCGRPTGHNFGHPLHRKQTFFLRVALCRPICDMVATRTYDPNYSHHRDRPRVFYSRCSRHRSPTMKSFLKREASYSWNVIRMYFMGHLRRRLKRRMLSTNNLWGRWESCRRRCGYQMKNGCVRFNYQNWDSLGLGLKRDCFEHY